MEEQPPDAQLIRIYLDGRDGAFEKLYKRYERPLFSFIFRFVGNRAMAEDLFQQTWMKVLQGFSGYEERGRFSSWLFGIANNACIDCVRKATRAKRDDFASSERLENLPDPDRGPEAVIERREEIAWLQEAVTQLPWEQKQVVLLRVYGELPFKEIARMLKSPLNTVLGRMHYAVRNLRKMVKQTYGEPRRNVLS